MAKDYTELAKEVVASVGGKENIISVSNCMTRLRFILKDDSIPNENSIKEINGVAGVINQGGQYQVILEPMLLMYFHLFIKKLILWAIV